MVQLSVSESPKLVPGGEVRTYVHPKVSVARLGYSRPMRVDLRDLQPGDILYGMTSGDHSLEEEIEQGNMTWPEGKVIEWIDAPPNRGSVRIGARDEYPMDFSGLFHQRHLWDNTWTESFAFPVWAQIALPSTEGFKG